MSASVRFHDQHPETCTLSQREELLAGLRGSPKSTSPKLFYDRRGSELFDRICLQPEYYLTRTEEDILATHAAEIAALVGENVTLLELGSGASRKIRLLLEALCPRCYLGIDISREFLLQSTQQLAEDYPGLQVHAIWADFCQPLRLPETIKEEQSVAFFPGSSIGNFAPEEALAFLRHVCGLLPGGSGLLIGVDLIKDSATLEAAYDDAAGVTAAFNLNLLHRLEREFDAKLDTGGFSHRALYNREAARIEMHLVSQRDQGVTIDGEQFHFSCQETWHTESSYKYSVEGFQALAEEAGFSARRRWTDPDALFSVHYLERPG